MIPSYTFKRERFRFSGVCTFLEAVVRLWTFLGRILRNCGPSPRSGQNWNYGWRPAVEELSHLSYLSGDSGRKQERQWQLAFRIPNVVRAFAARCLLYTEKFNWPSGLLHAILKAAEKNLNRNPVLAFARNSVKMCFLAPKLS